MPMSLSSSVLSARMFQQIDDVNVDKAGKRDEIRKRHMLWSERSIDELAGINKLI